MNRREHPFLRTAVAVWVVALLGALGTAGSAPAAGLGQLDKMGRWFVDSSGRVVILHGTNVVQKQPPYLPSAVGVNEEDAAFLARHGFNAIRLGVLPAGIEPEPGRFDESYLDSIAETMRIFARHGIYSLLDFHQDQYNERFQGQGFPDWMVIDDGLPNPPLGFPGNYFGNPALQRAEEHFFANTPGPGGVGLQDRLAAIWRHVAERFRNAPGLLGYDLLNEPLPGTAIFKCVAPTGCGEFESGALTEFSRKMLAAIREVDPAGLVHYETVPTFAFLGTAPSSHGPLGDPHVAFSWHMYCIQGAIGSAVVGELTCPPYERDRFQRAEEAAARGQAPPLITEFGTAQTETVHRIADLADQSMMGWLHWTYLDLAPGPLGPPLIPPLVKDPSRPPEGDNVDHEMLAAIVRPFPRVVAGTPESWSFDRATSTFRLTFKTTRPDGTPSHARESEIFLPELVYRDGYTVALEGADLLPSGQSGQLLRIRNKPNAHRVSLVVTPG